jgi:hypothetical protein
VRRRTITSLSRCPKSLSSDPGCLWVPPKTPGCTVDCSNQKLLKLQLLQRLRAKPHHSGSERFYCVRPRKRNNRKLKASVLSTVSMKDSWIETAMARSQTWGVPTALRRMEVAGAWLALLVFKTSVGLLKVQGGFDSHAPPPIPRGFQVTGAAMSNGQ